MSEGKKKAETMTNKRIDSAKKDKANNEVIHTTTREEYKVLKDFGRKKKGEKIKVHPITAVSLVEKGLIE
jgi:hypothetical protein